MNIAFLGTGRLGTELARHLIKNPGLNVTVWNRTKEKTESLVQSGASVAEDPREAVRDAELVVSCLFNANAVRDLVIDSKLIGPGVTWADVTTVSPAESGEFAEAVPGYVATPVVGTLGPARNQALGVFVGSKNEDTRRKAYELVKVWGGANPERVKQVGSAERAAVGKLLANLALAVSAQGFKEALLFGESQGLSADEVSEMLGSTGLEFIRNMKRPFVTGERETAPGDFTVEALAKDARLILDTSPVPLPAVSAALGSLDIQEAHHRGGHDFSSILVNRRDNLTSPENSIET